MGASHRIARGVVSAPPPHTVAVRRKDFSEAALEIVNKKQPAKQATTDKVARRFIASALHDDPTLSKEQLKQIRAGSGSSKPPPAPPMPNMELDVQPEPVFSHTQDAAANIGAHELQATRSPPPAPAMPTLNTATSSGYTPMEQSIPASSSEQSMPAKRRASGDLETYKSDMQVEDQQVS